jgi:FixJ family two-component response regulator
MASSPEAHAGRTEVASHLAELTPRQRQVLDGVLEGKPSKIIAAELGLSAKTVDVHRARIMEKLGAQSLPDLFRLVVLARSEKV